VSFDINDLARSQGLFPDAHRSGAENAAIRIETFEIGATRESQWAIGHRLKTGESVRVRLKADNQARRFERRGLDGAAEKVKPGGVVRFDVMEPVAGSSGSHEAKWAAVLSHRPGEAEVDEVMAMANRPYTKPAEPGKSRGLTKLTLEVAMPEKSVAVGTAAELKERLLAAFGHVGPGWSGAYARVSHTTGVVVVRLMPSFPTDQKGAAAPEVSLEAALTPQLANFVTSGLAAGAIVEVIPTLFIGMGRDSVRDLTAKNNTPDRWYREPNSPADVPQRFALSTVAVRPRESGVSWIFTDARPVWTKPELVRIEDMATAARPEHLAGGQADKPGDLPD